MFSRSVFASCFALSMVFCAAPAFAGKVELTTYYPAPYGEYTTLQASTLYFQETGANPSGLIAFNYADTTYDGRLRITAGKTDTFDNDQGANIDLHGINHNSNPGGLDLVAGRGGDILFYTSPAGTSASERMRISSSGNVGIGTSAPAAVLDMSAAAGTMIVPRLAADPVAASSVNGMIYYNTATNKFRGYENGIWMNLAGGMSVYDSGWFAVTQGSSYSLTHSLGIIPRSVNIWHSASSDGNNPRLVTGISCADVNVFGISVRAINTTTAEIVTGRDYIYYWLAGGHALEWSQSGYCRVILSE